MQTYTFSCLFAKQNEDLEVLKSLIEPTVRWIEITETSDKYEKDMQDSRFIRFYNRWIRENGREPLLDDIVYEVKGQALDTVWDIKPVDPNTTLKEFFRKYY